MIFRVHRCWRTAADNIDVSALNGIYFVKIVLADGHQVVEKIVVK